MKPPCSSGSERHEADRTLLIYGLAAGLGAVLLALVGNDLMRVAVILGAVSAYVLVGRRDIYPQGRIMGPVRASAKPPLPVAAGWLLVLVSACCVGTSTSAIDIPVFSGPDLVDRISKLFVIVQRTSPFFPAGQKAVLAKYSTLIVRSLDHLILVGLCLYVSITGSACLYWLSIRRKAETACSEIS